MTQLNELPLDEYHKVIEKAKKNKNNLVEYSKKSYIVYSGDDAFTVSKADESPYWSVNIQDSMGFFVHLGTANTMTSAVIQHICNRTYEIIYSEDYTFEPEIEQTKNRITELETLFKRMDDLESEFIALLHHIGDYKFMIYEINAKKEEIGTELKRVKRILHGVTIANNNRM